MRRLGRRTSTADDCGRGLRRRRHSLCTGPGDFACRAATTGVTDPTLPT